MAGKTKAKATGKTGYISRSVYIGTRTRSVAETNIYRIHADEASKRTEQKRVPKRQYA